MPISAKKIPSGPVPSSLPSKNPGHAWWVIKNVLMGILGLLILFFSFVFNLAKLAFALAVTVGGFFAVILLILSLSIKLISSAIGLPQNEEWQDYLSVRVEQMHLDISSEDEKDFYTPEEGDPMLVPGDLLSSGQNAE